ncbi:MAG: hypothetical protein DCF15_17350 [Phormidesmis priestleyi]|uniref:Pentapeptide repeat-containing protein n=1 Tax=Phormidesmis priestleyi TaxID=268141 RepID=A0A2W4YPS4_9CYAN|nr:MAG: hypothetical protein DCF15_17350 [Phormidesmis priestleyi]
MYIEIIDLIRSCDRARVDFAVGTVLTAAITGLAVAVASPQAAQAADEAAIQRLIETNECPGCDLHEADFRRLDLSGANLAGADLEGANFYYANLDGAQLTNANLIDVNFGYTSAQNTVFDGSDLRYAVFTRTNLSGASMIKTDLREAYINGAIFTNTLLNNADMRDTLYTDADFSQADLCGSITWAGLDYRRGCTVAVPTEIDDPY